ncbi:hypothetical protein [Geothrix edaphica]|uniref:hypothetical protein n=1 Tax=Geothrix edaphica TaxID=2927976 RepID=UPI00255643DF|nr:hypothetical protein [Geothrix edaphica]
MSRLDKRIRALERRRKASKNPWRIVMGELPESALLEVLGVAVDQEMGRISDAVFAIQCLQIINDSAPNLETRDRWMSLLGAA